MSVNQVILIGRLGRDPEVRYLPNGEAVANFGLATSENWKDRNGEKQERTEWHNIVMYRKLAEIAGQYLKKGAQVYITGRLLMVAVRMVISRRFEQSIAKAFQVSAMNLGKQNVTSFGLMK